MSIQKDIIEVTERIYVENLIKIYNDNKKDNELEVVFRLNLSKNDFLDLLRNLKNPELGLKLYNEQSLDITLNNSKIRRTIVGSNNIAEYCNTNSFTNIQKAYSDIFKTRYRFSQSEKEEYNIPSSELFAKYRNDDYMFNLNLKVETKPKPSDIQSFEKDIRESSSLKTFRYKNRFSFTSDKYKFDLTIVKVKQNIYDDYDQYRNFKEFIGSDLNESYEVEIEFSKEHDVEYDNMIEIINIMLEKIHKTKILVSRSEEELVKKYYKCLISTNTIEILENRLNNLKVVQDLLSGSGNNDLSSYTYESEGIKDINDINLDYSYTRHIVDNKYSLSDINEDIKHFEQQKNSIMNFNYKKDIFKSPKPISLSIPDFPKIENEYTVTDKADGISALMIIIGDGSNLNSQIFGKFQNPDFTKITGKVYIIDPNLRVYDTGILNTDTDLNDTLMNGELISHDNRGEVLNKQIYKAYDVYLNNSKDTKNLPLMDGEKNRYGILNNIIEKINMENSIYEISSKRFEKGNYDVIKVKSREIWDEFKNGKTKYKYDGLIFTPLKMPVGYNNTTYYDTNRLVNGIEQTWHLNFKWKPLNENTIDFYVIVNHDVKYTTSQVIEGDIRPIKYKEVTLYCSQKGSPVIFTPLSDINVSKAFVPLDDNGKLRCYDNTLLESETIVEFLYTDWETEEEVGFRWKPMRLRNDKTIELKSILKQQNDNYLIMLESVRLANQSKLDIKSENFLKYKGYYAFKYSNQFKYNGEQNVSNLVQFLKEKTNLIKSTLTDQSKLFSYKKPKYGNDIFVGMSVWQIYLNPVKEDHVFGITNVDNKTIQEYNESYYSMSHENREHSILYNMQNYHSRVIKGDKTLFKVIDELNANGISDLHLLDLASGKGADLNKWVEKRISKCLGIEILEENIKLSQIKWNSMKVSNKLEGIMDCAFIRGDLTFDFGKENKGKIIQPLTTEIKDEYFKKYGNEQSKFNIITCNFAIHYMFRSIVTFRAMINHISNNIADYGYFITTCLDGNLIYKMLNDKKQVSREIRGKTAWSITRKWAAKVTPKQEEFSNNSDSLDYKIGVYLTTFDKETDECLVSPEFLINELEKRDIVVKETQLFSSDYEKYDKDQRFMMSEVEKEFSFMNRYYVFQHIPGFTFNVKEIEKSLDKSKSNLSKILQSRPDLINKQNQWAYEKYFGNIKTVSTFETIKKDIGIAKQLSGKEGEQPNVSVSDISVVKQKPRKITINKPEAQVLGKSKPIKVKQSLKDKTEKGSEETLKQPNKDKPKQVEKKKITIKSIKVKKP